MIGPDPGSIFRLCGTHPMCAVQDPGAYGGYFNNGLFVTNVKWEIIEVCSESSLEPTLTHAFSFLLPLFQQELLHAWWQDNPPWRQIAMQDIMNEVFNQQWKPLPEDYNFQGMKNGHYWEVCSARFVHYKGKVFSSNHFFPVLQPFPFSDCDKHLDIPFCKEYVEQRKEAAEAYPELFNYQFKH